MIGLVEHPVAFVRRIAVAAMYFGNEATIAQLGNVLVDAATLGELEE